MSIDNIINLISALLGAIVGGAITFFSEWKVRKSDDKQSSDHASSLLYYDLISIQSYLKSERGSVNIRYSTEWQDLLAQCYFLESKDIEYIYNIYDMVYNYNFYYEKKSNSNISFRKEEIPEYELLKKLIFDCSRGYPNFDLLNIQYGEIMSKLKVKK